MHAPKKFAAWMAANLANDNKFGRRVFRYHPRSDDHSKMLSELVLDDLRIACPVLHQHLESGAVVAGINASITFPNGKTKKLDLGIGEPVDSTPRSATAAPYHGVHLKNLRIACEAKQCMTEHSKSKPRIFDELSSSHEIVHQGDTKAIAAGIVVVNIADKFASPTRQRTRTGPLIFNDHRQPRVTESMVRHLGGLVMRSKVGAVGFDAFATMIVDCDNLGLCRLHTDAPAPQPGDVHHYETFLRRISDAYAARFA